MARIWELPIDYTKLTQPQRREVRLQYITRQSNKCQHCGEPLDGPPSGEVQVARVNHTLFPPSFFNHPIHLHHSHRTGMTIGAVHARCNAVLWQFHGE